MINLHLRTVLYTWNGLFREAWHERTWSERKVGAVILSTAGVDNTPVNQISVIMIFVSTTLILLHFFQVRDVLFSLWFLMSKDDTRNLR